MSLETCLGRRWRGLTTRDCGDHWPVRARVSVSPTLLFPRHRLVSILILGTLVISDLSSLLPTAISARVRFTSSQSFGNPREGITGFRHVCIFVHNISSAVTCTALRAFLRAHMPQNQTPRLRSRVTFLKRIIIIPHQLTIRFCHNRLLRVRVHRRSTVEIEPRVG